VNGLMGKMVLRCLPDWCCS